MSSTPSQIESTETKDLAGDFARRLIRGPALLFLGQDYHRLQRQGDPVLAEILRKYASAEALADSYSRILESSAREEGEVALAWMDSLASRVGAPEWMSTVASVSWSGVYSSAIDASWSKAFRNDWRDVRPLFEDKYRPADPRNRLQLHCTFLYGSVGRIEEGERPPLSPFELAKRQQVAIALLRRLPELVTPVGTLVIEGYALERDWLRQDDLWAVVDELAAGQTHIFSAGADQLTHPFAVHLLRTGKLVAHPESLATAIGLAQQVGIIGRNTPPIEDGVGRRVSLPGASVEVPKDVWTLATRSAVILDDSAIESPPRLSGEMRYRDFRRFLVSAEGRPDWTAYAQGFAFERDFQSRLRIRVDKALASKDLAEEPIVLHGPTGTGKTIALSLLAFEIRKTLKYPVLFIERKPARPSATDVDRFCKWMEDAGAPVCLIVWDGMSEADEYTEFLRQLTSRGRKVVVVGSTYRLTTNDVQSDRLIEASALLSEQEIVRLSQFLLELDESLADSVDVRALASDPTFFVALYRLLPSTRGQLRSGIAREVGVAEQLIARRASETPPVASPTSVLGLALKKAGLLLETPLFEPTDAASDRAGTVSDLTGLVMVPGRFGVSVPLEVVLRVLGRQGYQRLSRLFEGIDVFRWDEDGVGNITIGPRNALEARLLVQARLGGARTEVAMAIRLLSEIRDDRMGASDGREVRFAFDLVRAMGAQGTESAYFAPYFNELSGTLRRLRLERSVRSPRLMLQEANLLREWAVEQAKTGSRSTSVMEALEEAEKVLREALEEVGTDRRWRLLRSALTVELGSVLASNARHALDTASSGTRGVTLFVELRDALAQARKADPSNYYPVDVLAWATRDILSRSELTDEERAEAVADVLAAFNSVDERDFRADQIERFHSRRFEFASFVGEAALEESALARLAAMGATAGYYLTALKRAGLLGGAGITDVPPDKLRLALEYLDEHSPQVAADARCLNLRFDLWWRLQAGLRLFERERMALPFDGRQWEECLTMVQELRRLEQSPRDVSLHFIEALALFHLGDVVEALDEFKQVERESDQVRGRRRVVRSYLASTPSGSARKVHGTVAWIGDDGRKGEVFVEELRRKVQFIPSDFGRLDFSRGESLGEFHLAFNFLGVLADPVAYHRE